MTDPRALVAFIRARLEDLRADADSFHDRGDCASTEWRGMGGPCDCGEPNRRRRRAFTHGNLVDEIAAQLVDDPDDQTALAYLGHLAAEWSDHPDYLTEWGPQP